MKKVLVLSLLTAICLVSCKDKESDVISTVRVDGRSLTEIHIDNVPSEKVELKFSDIFTDFTITALETSDNSLLKTDGSKVWFTEDNIFVSYQNASSTGLFPASLMRFDRQGNFKNTIGRGGRGPGEHQGYFLANLICSDEDQTLVAPWEGAGNEGPMIYKYDGTWIGQVTYPLEMMGGNICQYSDGEWFWTGVASGNPGSQKDSALVIFFDQKGEIVKLIPRTSYPPSGGAKYTPPAFNSSPYMYKGNYKVYLPGNDTIYTIDDNSMIPSGIVYPGNNGLPFNKFVEPSTIQGMHRISLITETDNNILLTKSVILKAEVFEYSPGRWGGSYSNNTFLIVIDKKSGKAITAELKDDVLGLFPDVNLTPLISTLENNRISLPFESIIYLNTLTEKGIDKGGMLKMAVSEERLRNLTAESNPVIVSFVLKDHISIK
jgi:hypothetical protein